MPKRVVGSEVGVAGFNRVKYEKSSVALEGVRSLSRVVKEERSYRCAPSARAMKGMFGQSNSAAGSAPSSEPNHASISGPL